MFGDGIKHLCRLCWRFIISVNDCQQLVNHHRAYSATTAGTVAPRHTLRCGVQDHDNNYVQTYFIRQRSLQAKLARPLPQTHGLSVGRTFFFVHALASDSI
jgi:hypothetical protein